MTPLNNDNILSLLQPLIAEDYPRFSQAVDALTLKLQQHFKRLETPEDDQNQMVGHFGLRGEVGNSLGFIFTTKLSRLPEPQDCSAQPEEELMEQWAHRLHARCHEESQFGRRWNNGENLLEAFHRIDHDIAKWTEKNRDKMPAAEGQQIDELRKEFKTAFDRLETAIEGIGDHFAVMQPDFEPIPLKDLLKLYL